MPTFENVTDEDLELIDRALAPRQSECTLDVPVPPSTNKIRRIDWANHRKHQEWRDDAGWALKFSGQWRRRLQGLKRYTLEIILDESQVATDPDNVAKSCSDLLKTIGVIVDDGPKNARQILIRWGEAPRGIRLIVRTA